MPLTLRISLGPDQRPVAPATFVDTPDESREHSVAAEDVHVKVESESSESESGDDASKPHEWPEPKPLPGLRATEMASIAVLANFIQAFGSFIGVHQIEMTALEDGLASATPYSPVSDLAVVLVNLCIHNTKNLALTPAGVPIGTMVLNVLTLTEVMRCYLRARAEPPPSHFAKKPVAMSDMTASERQAAAAEANEGEAGVPAGPPGYAKVPLELAAILEERSFHELTAVEKLRFLNFLADDIVSLPFMIDYIGKSYDRLRTLEQEQQERMEAAEAAAKVALDGDEDKKAPANAAANLQYLTSFADVSNRVRTTMLGRDGQGRRYWMFHALPGIHVEVVTEIEGASPPAKPSIKHNAPSRGAPNGTDNMNEELIDIMETEPTHSPAFKSEPVPAPTTTSTTADTPMPDAAPEDAEAPAATVEPTTPKHTLKHVPGNPFPTLVAVMPSMKREAPTSPAPSASTPAPLPPPALVPSYSAPAHGITLLDTTFEAAPLEALPSPTLTSPHGAPTAPVVFTPSTSANGPEDSEQPSRKKPRYEVGRLASTLVEQSPRGEGRRGKGKPMVSVRVIDYRTLCFYVTEEYWAHYAEVLVARREEADARHKQAKINRQLEREREEQRRLEKEEKRRLKEIARASYKVPPRPEYASQWFVYETADAVQELIDALNDEVKHERRLKRVLNTNLIRILASLPQSQANVHEHATRRKNALFTTTTGVSEDRSSVTDLLIDQFRNSLGDIEQECAKVGVGSVEDRKRWRTRVMTVNDLHGFKEPLIEWAFCIWPQCLRGAYGVNSEEEPPITLPAVKDGSVMERWKAGATQATTITQMFNLLQSLTEHIVWEKAPTQSKCLVCKHKGHEDKMLLCDICNAGYHMYCLRPALSSIPKGDWWCPLCVRKKAGGKNSKSGSKPKASKQRDDGVISCICGDNRNLPGMLWVACERCDVWSHSRCVNYLGGAFTCAKCEAATPTPRGTRNSLSRDSAAAVEPPQESTSTAEPPQGTKRKRTRAGMDDEPAEPAVETVAPPAKRARGADEPMPDAAPPADAVAESRPVAPPPPAAEKVAPSRPPPRARDPSPPPQPQKPAATSSKPEPPPPAKPAAKAAAKPVAKVVVKAPARRGAPRKGKARSASDSASEWNEQTSDSNEDVRVDDDDDDDEEEEEEWEEDWEDAEEEKPAAASKDKRSKKKAAVAVQDDEEEDVVPMDAQPTINGDVSNKAESDEGEEEGEEVMGEDGVKRSPQKVYFLHPALLAAQGKKSKPKKKKSASSSASKSASDEKAEEPSRVLFIHPDLVKKSKEKDKDKKKKKKKEKKDKKSKSKKAKKEKAKGKAKTKSKRSSSSSSSKASNSS